jgi:hypothetical protein
VRFGEEEARVAQSTIPFSFFVEASFDEGWGGMDGADGGVEVSQSILELFVFFQQGLNLGFVLFELFLCLGSFFLSPSQFTLILFSFSVDLFLRADLLVAAALPLQLRFTLFIFHLHSG